jgi:hypothetical protein
MSIWIRFAAALLVVVPTLGEEVKPPLDEGLKSIQGCTLYDTCRNLCSVEYAGRLTGHPGYTAMARQVAERFAGWGLRPIEGTGSFLQPFDTEFTVVDEAEMTLFLANETGMSETERSLRLGEEFLPLLYADSLDRAAGVVFAGWGISAPSLGYDDYAGVDVRDSFVLCFRGVPDSAEGRFTEFDEHRARMKAAHSRGALGIVYIYDEPQANPNGDWQPGFAPAVVSGSVADLILKERGLTSAQLRQDLSKYKRPLSFPLKSRLRLRVSSRHTPQSVGYNVVAKLDGSDPKLKQEYVILGAHADHCGAHLGNVYPGANDNASGSAVVIELARVFAQLRDRPKRSLLFVLFGGEETGLKGSHRFAEKLGEIAGAPVGMLNFDMVGEGDGVSCGFSQQAEFLKDVLATADAPVKILRGLRPIVRVGVRSSDFAPFFRRGIPCVSVASNGPHLAYHQVGDTMFRINPDILAQTARLGFGVAYLLADR